MMQPSANAFLYNDLRRSLNVPPCCEYKWPTGSLPNAKMGSPISGVSTQCKRI
jgi:hypothetical protein